MKSKKLPSGSYRVQKQINGKRISITFDHKPTKKEIETEIAHRLGYYNGKLTFEAAAINYINARTNILSPSTIRGYRQIMNSISDSLKMKAMDDLTNNDIQREVNLYAGSVAPKTVKNRYTFISSIFAEFRPDFKLRVNLPMMVRKEPYIPTHEEIRLLLSEAQGTQYYTALLLACCGLRRGELCALTMNDIDFDNNVIRVNKDVVYSDTKELVVKQPKTLQSIRDVVVPDSVIESIKQNGLFTKNPHSLSTWMYNREDKLGIPRFGIHKLRHYFVSAAHEKGLSDASIMQAGGWAAPNVMIKHYRHAQNTDAVTTAVLEDIV